MRKVVVGKDPFDACPGTLQHMMSVTFLQFTMLAYTVYTE